MSLSKLHLLKCDKTLQNVPEPAAASPQPGLSDSHAPHSPGRDRDPEGRSGAGVPQRGAPAVRVPAPLEMRPPVRLCSLVPSKQHRLRGERPPVLKGSVDFRGWGRAMPETGSERRQRSPAPEPSSSGAPPRCRLPLPAPCAAPPGPQPAQPPSPPGARRTPGRSRWRNGEAAPVTDRAAGNAQCPRRSPSAAAARRGEGPAGLPGGAEGCSPRAGRADRRGLGRRRRADARSRLTPPWPQPRRAARAPLAPTKFAARQLRASPGGRTQRPAAGAEQPRPPGPGDAVRGSARPAAGAAPGWGDLALLPALPRAPPSGPAEKLQLVEIFVLRVCVFLIFYFLLFLNHRSSQKHDPRLLLFHQI